MRNMGVSVETIEEQSLILYQYTGKYVQGYTIYKYMVTVYVMYRL